MARKPKVRPCKKGCGYPSERGRQFCYWHILLRESADVQAFNASVRKEAHLRRSELRARVSKAQWPPGERWCAGCQSFVPNFYTSGSRCKSCASASAHAGRIQSTYGITDADYRALLKVQGGKCAICRAIPRTMRLAVDHDHKTGQVRGLLCKRCNHDLLGGGRDSAPVLARALYYLLRPPANHGWDPGTTEELREKLRELI